MATYLVTGATGFLGIHLCEALLGAGHKVRALCRGEAGNLREAGVDVRRGDVLDRAAVADALKGTDGVFHLAGRVSRDPAAAAELHRLHVQGTLAVVDGCRTAGVKRMVHCSTSGTVGVTLPPGEELDESAQPDLTVVGKWPYYLSKIYAEQAALAAARDGLEVVSINPSLLLGPGDIRGESTRDIRLFMERKIPGIPAGGVSIVDVRDAAQALILGMEKGRSGERYLVTGLNTTVKAFFERVSRVSGVAAPLIPMSRPMGEISARFLDALAKTVDGYNPMDAVSVEMAGYCWYVSPHKAQEELGVEFRDPNLTLLDTVHDLRAHGVTTTGQAPAGSGLAEALLADTWRAVDRWMKKAAAQRPPQG
ncbi:MAG: NAD-dependent epimerase/dehydratase family protein [Deltaproteobacteria bacterium]|nr:NAD-dependent epimerase/dehydratase family protein [Deltaproteobacteria bacterium]